MKILICLNCITGGFAEIMKRCFPKSKIIFYSVNSIESNFIEFSKDITEADYFITLSNHPHSEKVKNLIEQTKVRQNFYVPQLQFRGFHPDLTYVRNINTGKFLKTVENSDYHSGIIIVAAANKLKNSKIENLFNKTVYDQIGYTGIYQGELKKLRQKFIIQKYDTLYLDYMLAAINSQPFMHTINHPKMNIIAAAAFSIARKIDSSVVLLEPEEIMQMKDALAHEDIWPIYPDILDNFTSSEMIWKFGSGNKLNLADYIRESIMQYRDFDFNNVELLHVDKLIIDKVIKEYS